MTDSTYIRRSIFRDELNFVFTRKSVNETDGYKIASELFSNYFSASKQLILKDSIKVLDDIKGKLSSIIHDTDVISEIGNIFFISDDLQLPTEINQAFADNEKVAIITGAGVSKLLKLPLWSELANFALEYLYDRNFVNHFEYQRLRTEMYDPKQKLTIFHSFIPKASVESINFYQNYFASKTANFNPYDFLVQFGATNLTINIDDEFGKSLDRYLNKFSTEPKPLSNTPEDKKAKRICDGFDIKALNKQSIYHLHGHIDNFPNTIWVTKDYIREYFQKKDEVNSLAYFLRELFSEYMVIFVGYGLEEFPLLEHLFISKRRHYTLIATYLHEINYLRIRQRYFDTLKITAIPYYLDFNGYERLGVVLKSWAQQINECRKKIYYDKFHEIDRVLHVERNRN